VSRRAGSFRALISTIVSTKVALPAPPTANRISLLLP
jgi:hypothetical protein